MTLSSISKPEKSLDLKSAVVNSHNEWDTLREVIVGRVEGSTVPQLEAGVKVDASPRYWQFFQQLGGSSFPEDLVTAAAQELNEFCRVLAGEGVIVRRPDLIDFSQPYKTPDFESTGIDN